MRWRCRCNQRICQARKTLPKHPDDYKHGRPKCRIPDCTGTLYALKDQSLKERGITTCHLDCLPYPHNISHAQCIRREDYVVALGDGGGESVLEPDW